MMAVATAQTNKEFSIQMHSNSTNAQIRRFSVLQKSVGPAITYADSATLFLSAGSVVRPHAVGAGPNISDLYGRFTITKVNN